MKSFFKTTARLTVATVGGITILAQEPSASLRTEFPLLGADELNPSFFDREDRVLVSAHRSNKCPPSTRAVSRSENQSQVSSVVEQPQSLIDQKLGTMREVGSGTFWYARFFHVYDARLLVADDANLDGSLALELTYARDLKGKDIVYNAIWEMQRLRNDDVPAEWEGMLRQLIPDVKSGETLMGVRTENGTLEMYRKGAAESDDFSLVDAVDDAELAQCFFQIWLDPNASHGVLRNDLLKDL